MEITFLEKTEGCSKLILIFPGWSFGKGYYEHIHVAGWDIAVVTDYNEPSLKLSPLDSYSTIYLFAWSLGVFMASVCDFNNKITAAYSINGTLTPAHDSLGIPSSIYEKTAENLSPASLLKFRRRMAGSMEIFKQFHDSDFSEDRVSKLKNQLLNILKWQQSIPVTTLPWRKSFISKDDAIFPFENQVNFWQKNGKMNKYQIVQLSGPHFVSIEEIIHTCIPDTERVANNFSNASGTYDKEAIAQQKLSEKLITLIKASGLKKGKTILEIGPGTGLLTKKIISELAPTKIDLVDISDVRPPINEINSDFFIADAEKWIAETDRVYDAILSSATVQWFMNLPLFIKNAHSHLKENGLLAFSTFLPGNLHELDQLRPAPIHYHGSEDIEGMLNSHFADVRVELIDITLEFSSLSALLKHLKKTGVGGSAPKRIISLSQAKNIKTLTFKCGCFSAKKGNLNE